MRIVKSFAVLACALVFAATAAGRTAPEDQRAPADAVKAAKVEAKERADTHVFVSTEPPGATVSVEGVGSGASPRLFEVPEGARRVTVTVELEGFEKEARTIEVRGGRVTRIEFELRPEAAESLAPAGGETTVATTGKAAPAAPLGARGTAQAFLRALFVGGPGELGVDRSLYEGPIDGLIREARKFAERFDVARAAIETTLVEGGYALAVTEAFPSRDGAERVALGFSLERDGARSGAGWSVRDVDFLPKAEDRERFVAEFRKRHPAASEEPTETPRDREIRDVAERYGRALLQGDAAALGEFWRYDEPLDELAGETLLWAIAQSRERGPVRLDLVLAAPCGKDGFLACWLAQGLPMVGDDPEPWLQFFEAEGDVGTEGEIWRTVPIPNLRTIVEGRDKGPTLLARKAGVRAVIDHRFGGVGMEERLTANRATAEAFRRISGPPYRLSRFEGAAEGLDRLATQLEATRGIPWPEVERLILTELRGPKPEEIPEDWFLLFYLLAKEGEPCLSLPEAKGPSRVTLERFPCLTEDAVAETSVKEDTATGGAAVVLTLTKRGRELFGRITRENIDRSLAIVIEGKVISTPRIRDEIRSGEAVITGSFSLDEALSMASGIGASVLRVKGFLRELRERGGTKADPGEPSQP